MQAAHALQEFNIQYPELARNWHGESNTIVLLAVPDEASLAALLRKAKDKLAPISAFHEPDRQGELTAVALGPSGRRFVRDLPLALQSV